jgi:membrane protease YdiL (CAAX protease family)
MAVVGAVLFTFVAGFIGVLVYSGRVTLQDAISGSDAGSIGFMRIIQIASSIGTFILPSIAFAQLEYRGENAYFNMNRTIPSIPSLIAILVIFSFAPPLEYLITLNEHMKLPGILKPVEEWMRSEEDKMAALTRKLLEMHSIRGLVVNMVMIAVLPAIGEELFFRGCIQRTLGRWFRSYHAAVWITAILFSAIHLQFYGFIPRMLLGALLGYLYAWGKNIWLPVLAHFTNNAVSVIASYAYQSQGKPSDAFEKAGPGNPLLCLAGALATAVLLYVYWRLTRGGPSSGENDTLQPQL